MLSGEDSSNARSGEGVSASVPSPSAYSPATDLSGGHISSETQRPPGSPSAAGPGIQAWSMGSSMTPVGAPLSQ